MRNKKIILLISSIVVVFMATTAAIVVIQKQRQQAKHKRVKKHHKQETSSQAMQNPFKQSQADMHSNFLSSKQYESEPNLKIVKTKSKKQHADEAANSDALPTYYGTPLFDMSEQNNHEAAIELPTYYGTPTSLEATIINKKDAMKHLSDNYGTLPYKVADSITDPSRAKELITFDSPYTQERQEPKVDLMVELDTFFTGAHNQALLHDNQNYDHATFVQTIVNLPIYIRIPSRGDWGRLEFNFTPRLNTIWGSNQLAQTSREFVKIGRAITETKHYHEIDRSILWVRETWLKLYSRSEKTMAQIGFFPKQIGLGLILGDHYKSGNPILTNTFDKMIDQYRPGFEISTIFGERNYKASFYYSLYKNNATSFDRQVEFTQSQELCNCGEGPPFSKADPTRTPFQTTHLITAEVDIPIMIEKEMKHDLHVKPFILFQHDKNQTVEFFGDAQSNLITTGATFHVQNDKLDAHLDLAGNFGYQDVKAWDRNVTEEHARMTLTHLFAKSLDNVDPNASNIQEILASGEFILSPMFPYPPGKDISLQYAAGEEFQTNNPSLFIPDPLDDKKTININPQFKNSYSRFRRCYRNDFRAFMGAADLGYHFCDNMKVGMILGYASGDDRPNDTAEKAYLYRLRSDWDQARQDFDHCYQGFMGVQSLYTGKHVRSIQLLRSHRINEPLSQVPEITANLFSNMIYGGLGLWYDQQTSRGTLRYNINAVAMGLAHAIKFGFDPVIQDVYETFDFKEDAATLKRFENYDQRLSQYLGVELNAFLEFFTKHNLTFYASVSIFLPGSYYKDIAALTDCLGQNVPLKNQYVAKAKDKHGFENAEQSCITLLNNTAVVGYLGVRFDFDTATIQDAFGSRRKKKK